jgi:hypothetical protein
MSSSANRNIKSRILSRKALLIAVAVLIILVAGGWGYARWGDNESSKPTAEDSQGSGDYVNNNPPTDEELQETEQNKQSIIEQSSSNISGAITPIITSASRSEVRAYVSGVFEDGGTCTATATKGSQTRTASSEGIADVNKTTCRPMDFSPALTSGSWSVTVTYNSAKGTGKSDVWEIE